tara:strand:- start:317 stop:562 length:246 start_codon:yes stop_codon:yes gene_type:complete
MNQDKAKIIIESVEYFIRNNKVRVVKNQFNTFSYYEINGEKYTKKIIGSVIYLFVKQSIGFEKEWATLKTHLKKQLEYSLF